MENVAKLRRKKRTDWGAVMFVGTLLALPIVLFIFNHFYLNFEMVKLAFTNIRGEFTLRNFEVAFKDLTEDGGLLREALGNTLIFFFVNVFVINILTMFLSYFLFKRIFGYKIFRLALYLPSIIGSVAFVLVFKAIIGVGGHVYEIIDNIWGEVPEFYNDSRYALGTIIFYSIWTGLGGLLYQGAMARIPTEVFEAGILDGITPIKEFTKIVVPLIWPTITTLFIMSFAGIFSASGPILLFTKGDYGTYTIAFWLWDQVYTYNAVNSSSAVGLIFTVIGCPLALGFRKLMLKIQESVEY